MKTYPHHHNHVLSRRRPSIFGRPYNYHEQIVTSSSKLKTPGIVSSGHFSFIGQEEYDVLAFFRMHELGFCFCRYLLFLLNWCTRSSLSKSLAVYCRRVSPTCIILNISFQLMRGSFSPLAHSFLAASDNNVP